MLTTKKLKEILNIYDVIARGMFLLKLPIHEGFMEWWDFQATIARPRGGRLPYMDGHWEYL